MSNDEKQDKPVILMGIKHDSNHTAPPRMGVFNPNFKPSCGHDHSDGSTCGGHHDDEHGHHHDEDDHSHSNSLLKGALEPHRGKILIGLTGLVALSDHLAEQGVDIQPEFIVVGGATYVAFEASEQIMESVGKLKIPAFFVGTTLGAVHTLQEVFLAATTAVDGHAGLGMASTVMSNETHILLMGGSAALIGGIGVAKHASWKMNSVAIGLQTLATAYQVQTGFTPELSTLQGGAALGFLGWSYFAKQACAHGGACGHVTKGAAFEGDVLGAKFWRETYGKINIPPRAEALQQLSESMHSAKEKLQTISLPEREKVISTVLNKNIWGLGVGTGALLYCADKIGENVVAISDHIGMSETKAGLITSVANASPEMVLVMAAAVKAAQLKMDTSHSAMHAAQDAKDTAWGAVTSCTVATLAFSSMYYGFNNVDVPETLRWATTEGKVHMATFLGSAGLIAATTHDKVNEKFAVVDNKIADACERQNWNRASNWMRNSGKSVSKLTGAALLAFGIGYNATIALMDNHEDQQHQPESVEMFEIPQVAVEQDNDIPVYYEPEQPQALQL